MGECLPTCQGMGKASRRYHEIVHAAQVCTPTDETGILVAHSIPYAGSHGTRLGRDSSWPPAPFGTQFFFRPLRVKGSFCALTGRAAFLFRRNWVECEKIKGRQRHLLVDTLGLVLAVLMTSAGLDDGVAAPLLLRQLTPQGFPRRVTTCAEQQYPNHALDAWMAAHRTGWRLEVQARPEGIKGCTPLEKRWVMERTHAWHGRYRRNSKDYERSVESRTAMIQMSNINLMLNRLAPGDRPAFHYRRDAA
jgi:transposase